MHKSRGFTIIEILTVLAIIGLLAAIAIPSYRKSVQKSNRSDAKITLSRLATLEERYYFRANNYTGDFADIVTGATSGAPINSDGSYYSIVLTLSGGGTGWSMTATAQGTQATDTDCAKFTLTNLGTKTAVNSSNAANTSCW